MSKNKFKVGDVVVLKSGGPAMTVENIKDEKIAVCSWFHYSHDPVLDPNGSITGYFQEYTNRYQEDFNVETLNKYKKPKEEKTKES